MDTSDDLAAVFGGGGGDMKLPVTAEPTKKITAEPLGQLSEAAKKNRRRSASILTQGFEPPTLGKTGLLGG
jgi:hypothetical protein